MLAGYSAVKSFQHVCTYHTFADLQLVVICSQEREDHSYVATSMEQYRSNYVPVHNLESVKNFIKTNLQVTETTVVNPACSLDPER